MRMRDKLKVYDDRFADQIGCVDQDIQCQVVSRPLRALHPVNQAPAVAIRHVRLTPRHSRIEMQRLEVVH